MSDQKKTIPVYERFKGKTAHGSTSRELNKKEQWTVTVLAVVFMVLVIVALISFFLPIPIGFRILLFILAILSGIVGMGGYLFYLAFRGGEPVKMRYYKVDYAHNHLTGKRTDHTREISREEFFGKEKPEGQGEVLPGQKEEVLSGQNGGNLANPFEK